MSSGVALEGKLIVFETALSMCFCHAACILTCCSYGISCAVLNSFWMSFGTPFMFLTVPFFAICIIRFLL